MDSKGYIKIANIISIFVLILGLFFVVKLIWASELSVSATVGNSAPTISSLQVCSTSCADYKELTPATAFTIKAVTTDPNGSSDINWNSAVLMVYKSADTNESSVSWDHITLTYPTPTNGDGCTASGFTNCFPVGAGDWTVKFLKGGADVFLQISDNSGTTTYYELSYVAATSGILAGELVGMTLDSTSVTYSGSPDTNDNDINTNQGLNYVLITDSGNVDLNVGVSHTALASGENSILASNIHSSDKFMYFNDDNSPDYLPNISRGTYPTSGSSQMTLELDIPVNQPIGTYTGTMTVNGSAS